MPAALAVSAIAYYFAYQSIYAAEGGYALSRRQLTAVVASGFGELSTNGGPGRTGCPRLAARQVRRCHRTSVIRQTGTARDGIDPGACCRAARRLRPAPGASAA